MRISRILPHLWEQLNGTVKAQYEPSQIERPLLQNGKVEFDQHGNRRSGNKKGPKKI
jgi:hypothetical protein